MRDCAQKPDWKGEHRKCEHTQSYVSLGCEHGDQRSCISELRSRGPREAPRSDWEADGPRERGVRLRAAGGRAAELGSLEAQRRAN